MNTQNVKALTLAYFLCFTVAFAVVMPVKLYWQNRELHHTVYGQDAAITSVINTDNVKLLYIVAERSSLSCWTLTLGTMTQAVTCSNGKVNR